MKVDDKNMSCDSFFGLSIYGLKLHFNGGGQVRGFTGSAWRGLMGAVLQNAVCSYRTPVCTTCPSASTCSYPKLFKPTMDAMLPPFWLHGWHRISKGWIVGIRWIGRNHDYAVGEWLGALARAENGFSIGGQPVRLDHAVSAVTGQVLWCHKQGWHTTPEPLPLLRPYPMSKACQVQSLTPLVSKHTGNPLFGALHTRVQRLVLQHGDGSILPRPAEPWKCHERGHQEQHLALSKRLLTGSLWHLDLSEMDADAWALLCAGLELHAGGQSSMGCGQYEIKFDEKFL